MMATFVADEVWVYLFLKGVLKNSVILDVSEYSLNSLCLENANQNFH